MEDLRVRVVYILDQIEPARRVRRNIVIGTAVAYGNVPCGAYSGQNRLVRLITHDAGQDLALGVIHKVIDNIGIIGDSFQHAFFLVGPVRVDDSARHGIVLGETVLRAVVDEHLVVAENIDPPAVRQKTAVTVVKVIYERDDAAGRTVAVGLPVFYELITVLTLGADDRVNGAEGERREKDRVVFRIDVDAVERSVFCPGRADRLLGQRVHADKIEAVAVRVAIGIFAGNAEREAGVVVGKSGCIRAVFVEAVDHRGKILIVRKVDPPQFAPVPGAQENELQSVTAVRGVDDREKRSVRGNGLEIVAEEIALRE